MCIHHSLLPPLTVVHIPGHAAPIRVSRHRAVYAMKTEVRGYGAGWPLHVEISADNQVFLLRTVRTSVCRIAAHITGSSSI
jgi:hypothetical protein